MSRPQKAAGIFYAPQRKGRSEPVCIFAAIFNRVFRSRKIRLTFFKICQTYFKLCLTYFLFAPGEAQQPGNEFSLFPAGMSASAPFYAHPDNTPRESRKSVKKLA